MYEKYKCIIVDDDIMSLKILEALVAKTDFLELIGAYSSSIEAANVAREQPIDLIFLDIEMPNMTGLEFIKTLDKKPQIIIASSKKEYALDAFEYDVVDYLLKPIEDYSRFLKAVLKAKDKIMAEPKEPIIDRPQENIFIKVDSLLVNFDLKDIYWVEAYGDYVKIHTLDKTHTVYSTLKAIEEKLPSYDFVRIHRSYIVRIDKIKNIDQNNLEITGKVLPVSNSYKQDLIKRIKTL